MDQISKDAELVYNYHRMSSYPKPETLTPADAIFCLCSLDMRVASRAAELYLAGLAPLVIFSGNTGKLTAGLFDRPEAEVFAATARGEGVPPDAIIVEPESTNTGRMSLLLVQKPYMERRTFATFERQWPGGEGVRFQVTSPQMRFEEYFDEENPREWIVSVMVGDLVRIREYPERGFQMEQDIPDEVREAGRRLIDAGHDKHLP
ncbi:hypothetical protein ACRE_040380 [Hapsidospora chrysogenum ATCC 11550]|uniref:DUF218 domain-containing protein n=1 Tax=Hapsidospora chrysogenum (strain ATCC 11550 / CBS 779.69 / DSM 880 / IAM 14645 / JCM 23072 / IMI 49137) TaxID=857340 RepID=A0A086T728_HAPC1|nr:hypothetical protein ACRE_040380 [Hapsidospora chrysogenum ATCC 11550]